MEESQGQSFQQLNISKVRYFLQKNDQQKPNLPSQIGIMQLLREYLNDDDFNISYRGEPIFMLEGYEERLQKMYESWKQEKVDKLDIDQFIIYWASNQEQLEVRYTLYQDMTEDQRLYQASNVLTRNDQNRVKEKIDKSVMIKEEFPAYNKKEDRIKIPTSQSSLSHLNKQYLQPLDYLNKFFMIYSKQANAVSNATFNQYEQHYNSINLTKWMHFIRDIGLNTYSKVMNPKKMKEVFMKFENQEKILTFELFQVAVNELMRLLFGEDKQKIANDGYELLGIKNQHCFQEKFKKMGMLAPIFTTRAIFDMRGSHADTITSKVSLMKNIGNRLKLNKSVQIEKSNGINTGCIMSSSSKHLPKIKMNYHPKKISSEKQRSQIYMAEQHITAPLHPCSQLQQSRLTKVTAKHRRPHYNQGLMQQIMQQQQDDPYLKRYNSKQNIKYHCIANRIDERIQKIMNKYDQQ